MVPGLAPVDRPAQVGGLGVVKWVAQWLGASELHGMVTARRDPLLSKDSDGFVHRMRGE